MRVFASVLPAFVVALATPALAAPALPTTLHGQWTDDPAACGKEDVRGVVLSAGGLDFYEAHGTVEAVEPGSAGTLSARVAFTGEGRTWRETVRLAPAPDLATLTIGALGHQVVLRRCPNRI